MLYVVLGKDVRSKEGTLYAKKGKCLKVLFKNKNHYLCEIGKYTVPVFSCQIECETEITLNEEKDEIEEEFGD